MKRQVIQNEETAHALSRTIRKQCQKNSEEIGTS